MIDLKSDLKISNLLKSVDKSNCEYGGIFYFRKTETKLLIRLIG